MLASCNKDEHQHSYTSSVTTPATCSNPGVETFTCSCGYAYTQIIPATGDHDWQVLQVYPNSCESDGYTVYECSVCHEQKQGDWTAKRDHKYEAVETVEATCTTDGYQIMQCSYCGDRYTDDQYSAEHKATGHKWIVNTDPADPADLTDAEGWKVVKAADCLNAAQLERECSVCHEKEQKTGAAATGHMVTVNGKLTVKTDNLCKVNEQLVDAEGNKIYAFECENENCPVEVVVDARGNTKHFIKAVDHVMETVKEHINCEDTDDDKSYILEKCKNCDTEWTGADSEDGYKKTYVDEAGHDFNTVQTDGETDVVVCIKDDGLETRGDYLEYMRSVVDFTTYQANWQNYVTAWNNAYKTVNKGAEDASITDASKLSISRVCARCGEVTVANGHHYVIAKYVDGSFTEYEKDEEGALVDYSKEVTVVSMNCRYVQICPDCGTINAHGKHQNVAAATCRADGLCADCGLPVNGQLKHEYVNVATVIDYKNSSTPAEKALYNAYVKVSATETWMTPVKGDCDSKETTVYVCKQCLLDAVDEKNEVVWNQATELPATATDNGPVAAKAATNAYVITRENAHDYQPTYFSLSATDTTATTLRADQVSCQIGYKEALICSKCGDVYINVPVGDNPETKDVNEAENNPKNEDRGFTDANGFLLDYTSETLEGLKGDADKAPTMGTITVEQLAKLVAEDHYGEHLLYLTANYAEMNGYSAHSCLGEAATLPYTCLNCGTIVQLSATQVSDVNDETKPNDVKNTFEFATVAEVEAATGLKHQDDENNYNFYACAKEGNSGVEGGDLVTATVGVQAIENAKDVRHAGKVLACGIHCDANVNGKTCNVESNGGAHTAVTVSYQLKSGMKEFYDGYSVKIAVVGANKVNPASTDTTINAYITELLDAQTVASCVDTGFEAPSRANFMKDGAAVAGNYLVLVDANGKAYQLIDDSGMVADADDSAVVFYSEDRAVNNEGDAKVADIDDVTSVQSIDTYFVYWETTGEVPTNAPVSASTSASLTLALKNDPKEVTENGTKYDVYTVNVTKSFKITTKPDIPEKQTNEVRVVFELNGNTLTMDLENVDDSSKGVWLVQNELVFQNGNVVVESNGNAAFDVDAGASLTMDNVVLTTDNNAIRTDPTTEAGAEINLNKTTINSNGDFGVGTNANNVNNATTKDVVINIVDSNIFMNLNDKNEAGKGENVDNTALFINVPSKVTVEGSTLVANRQVVMVRGGLLEMSDSKLILEAASITGDSLTMDWGDGNTAPRAAMLLGNKNRSDSETAYQYKTTVILENVAFDVDAGDRTVVIASDYEESTILKQEDTKFPAGTADENKTFDNISTMPIMVYLDAGNCVTDKQIDFVPGYIPGTIQLIDCGNASGIY